MSHLQLFFDHATAEVHAHLRARRLISHHKTELEKHQRALAKRIQDFERKNETQIRLAWARVSAAEIELNNRIKQEENCWREYSLQYSKTDSLPKCLEITLKRFAKGGPTVAEVIKTAEMASAKWQNSFVSLRNAERDFNKLKSNHDSLTETLVSDRFATRTLATQIQQTVIKLENVEAEIKACIKRTAQHMSYSAIERKRRTIGITDQAFFDQLRRLRRLLEQIHALRHFCSPTSTETANGKPGDMIQLVEQESAERHFIPLQCNIELTGRGKIRSPNRQIGQSGAANRTLTHTRVLLSDTKLFEPNLELKRWNANHISQRLIDGSLQKMHQSFLELSHQQATNVIRKLDAQATVLTNRIAKTLFSIIDL